jgi:Mn-containing catalase
MFYHDSKLQYEVRVDNPSPIFAKYLQQAIGGIEGEIRVMMQYLFQAWGARGPVKYRNMLLETGTEEIAHVEMLATAVALNLEQAPLSMQEAAAQSPAVMAALGGMNPRHILSSGLAALPVNANGVPFDCSHVYASGNLVADMYANVTAESTGRALAVRLYNFTDDPGMKDMLRFLISRDTMHQNQWLAVIEELGGESALPIPNSHPQSDQLPEFTYSFMSTRVDESEPLVQGRWTHGKSIDGHGNFSTIERMTPRGGEPKLAPPRPNSGEQQEQRSEKMPSGNGRR